MNEYPFLPEALQGMGLERPELTIPHLTHFLTTENSVRARSRRQPPDALHQAGRRQAAAGGPGHPEPRHAHGLTQGPLKGGYNGKFFDSQEVLFKDDQWHCTAVPSGRRGCTPSASQVAGTSTTPQSGSSSTSRPPSGVRFGTLA